MEEKGSSNERGKLERAGKKGNQCISKGNMGEMEKENTFIKKKLIASYKVVRLSMKPKISKVDGL